MGYDVFICLDFEATCDNKEPPLVPRESCEITEFSWVALDVKTRTIIHAEQSYCRPCWSQVTEFCVTLTGITAELLEQKGGTLAEAVKRLSEFCDLQTQQGRQFCFVTHGIWDLEHQLPREAHLKAVPLPPAFGCYFNLMDIFSPACKLLEKTPEGKTLPAMCKTLGLDFDGQLHSGLDDSRNIAAIVAVLLASPEVEAKYFQVPVENLAQRMETFRQLGLHSLVVTSLPRRITREAVFTWLHSLNLPLPEVCSLVLHHGSPTRRVVFTYDTHDQAARALERLHWGAGFDAHGTQPGEDGDCLVFAKPLLPAELESLWKRFGKYPETAEDALNVWTAAIQTGDWFCAPCRQENWAGNDICRHCKRPMSPLLLPQDSVTTEWVQVINEMAGSDYGCLGLVKHSSVSYYLLDDGRLWKKADAVPVRLPAGFVTAILDDKSDSNSSTVKEKLEEDNTFEDGDEDEEEEEEYEDEEEDADGEEDDAKEKDQQLLGSNGHPTDTPNSKDA